DWHFQSRFRYVPLPVVRVVSVVNVPGDVEGESAAVLGLEQRDAVAAVAREEGGRRLVGEQRAAHVASAAVGAQEAVARQRARAAERVLELRRQRGLGQRAAEYGAEVEGRGGSYAVVAPHVEEAGGERLVDARGGHERVALRAGQEQRRDAQVAGEAAVEHRADVPAAIDPVVRLAAQVECRFADERAQAALGHERLRAPRVTAEQRPWIARRCDLVLLVAVLERDVERQPARRVARVRAPALAFEVVALVAVQQERRERCLEVADLPGLDRRDDRAGGKTDAQLAAAEELLRAHRITDPIATQWAVALRAQDRERLDAQRAPSAGFDPRPDGDGQAFDAVVVGAQLQHEPRVTRGQAGTAPVRTPAPALPARLALAFGAAVHQQRAADAAAPYAAYLAAHDRDVTGNGAAGQELDVAVDDDELALDAPRQ